MSSIDQGCPLATAEIPNAWGQASAVATRYAEIFDAERKLALRHNCSELEAIDQAQVAAWLDKEARAGRLRIVRGLVDGGRIARHRVLLLEEQDGEVVSTDIGGWCSMAELKRGLHEKYTSWLYTRDEIVEGYFRVEVMITDNFPDHEMFKRSDGSRIDLGFNDDDHFYLFTVDIPKEYLADTY